MQILQNNVSGFARKPFLVTVSISLFQCHSTSKKSNRRIILLSKNKIDQFPRRPSDCKSGFNGYLFFLKIKIQLEENYWKKFIRRRVLDRRI